MLLAFALTCAPLASAQTSGGDDYHKTELHVGYAQNRAEAERRADFIGYEASVTRNIRRFVGLKFDYSKHSTASFLEPNSSIQNFLGGVQFKNNSEGARFKPFAHLLAGVARTKIQPFRSDTGLAGAFGGGLDIRGSRHVDLRVLQLDYNPARYHDTFRKHYRVGFGIVIH
jgi:hypothetical protein